MKHHSGITVLEMLFVIVLVFFLMTSVTMIYIITLQGWGNLGHRSDLNKKLSFALDRISEEVAKATNLSAANHGLRFTLYESGANQSYIYYLYHASDTWPPAYTQSTYNLMRTTLTGEIGGTFTYGSGEIFATGITPPGSSQTSITVSGNVATLQLVGKEKNDTFVIRRSMCARNR